MSIPEATMLAKPTCFEIFGFDDKTGRNVLRHSVQPLTLLGRKMFGLAFGEPHLITAPQLISVGREFRVWYKCMAY